MTFPFRYAEKLSDSFVNLHLFKTINGTPRGDVRGPVTRHIDGRTAVFDQQMCLPTGEAFAAAVRMANRNDMELVVSGDRELWDANWGRLAAIAL